MWRGPTLQAAPGLGQHQIMYHARCPKADMSTLVPRLAGPVTSFQHSSFLSLSFFLCRRAGHGGVWGRDSSSQAEQIITEIAHPSARDELRSAGRDLGFRV